MERAVDILWDSPDKLALPQLAIDGSPNAGSNLLTDAREMMWVRVER